MPKLKRSQAAYPDAADLALMLGTAAKLTPEQIRKWIRRRKFREQIAALVALTKEYSK